MTTYTPRAPRVTAAADVALQASGIFDNDYFASLEDQSMPLDVFRESQQQFYFAVVEFPRPMAALIARIPDAERRLDILHNLVEEHGDFEPARFHAQTFSQFLGRIGGTTPQSHQMRPAVHGFNSILMAACATDDLDVGIGCIGVIERAFASLSARIGKAVVDRGWLPTDSMIHYTLHAELDLRHADEFFAILEPAWDHTDRRRMIERGLALGAYAFNQLYRGLLNEAAARCGG